MIYERCDCICSWILSIECCSLSPCGGLFYHDVANTVTVFLHVILCNLVTADSYCMNDRKLWADLLL